MLSYLEKFALFLTLMTIEISLPRMIDISVFEDLSTKIFMVISMYISCVSCFIIAFMNFAKFIEELIKELIKEAKK